MLRAWKRFSGRLVMLDVLMLALGGAGFALLAAYLAACARA